jgi:deoxyribose-phosphate aldolase
VSEPGAIPEIWIRQVAEEVARRMGSAAAGSQYGGSLAELARTERAAPTGSQSSDANASGGYGAVSPSASSCSSVACGCKLPGFENGPNPDRLTLLREYGVARVGCHPGIGPVDADLASMLDHTLLKPEATEREIATLCEEAHCHGFATVCVQPIWVPLCARILEDSRVRVCTVIGFPHGANRVEVKAYETEVAVAQGAREVDMVIPIGMMKSGDLKTVAAHVRAVVRAAIPGVLVKVILENAYLTDDEKRSASRICKEEGAHFVKTSTGFGPSGATLEDVRLMREVVGSAIGVKAAGGIRNTEGARAMVAAGANRIGASASIRIASR